MIIAGIIDESKLIIGKPLSPQYRGWQINFPKMGQATTGLGSRQGINLFEFAVFSAGSTN
jgi:hypothetical protein